MLAGTARFCFNLFGFYFADSACTAIGLPSASRISGCLPSVTHSLVTTTFFHLFQRRYAMHQYFPYRKQAAPAMCCKNCPYLFQSVWIYFADSACTAIGLPSASKISGCLPSVTHSLVTTTFFACSKDGTSYMVCTRMPSMMERRPLAPVFR